eukprot:COSAG01_NODE_2366_length_7816_cov_3.797460_10_plen_91_part_00
MYVQILRPRETSASWRSNKEDVDPADQMKDVLVKFDALEGRQALMHERLDRLTTDVSALVKKLIDDEPEPEPAKPEYHLGNIIIMIRTLD